MAADPYPWIRVTGVGSINGVNPFLLTQLNKLGQTLGRPIEVYSGYRSPGYSASVGGYSNDPHSRGEAVDASIGGVPIGQVVPLQTLANLGLEGGNTPGFYPAAGGDGRDPEHVQIPGSGVNKGMRSPTLSLATGNPASGNVPPPGIKQLAGPSQSPPGSTVPNDPSAMQNYFASEVAKQTGLDPRVVMAWSSQEGTYAPNGTGGFNFLNLRPYSSDVGVVSHSSGGFDQFRSLQDAIASSVARIKQPFLQQHLGPVLKAGGGPSEQIAAIAASGWDQDHYGGPGGPNLLRAYQGVQAPTTTYNLPGGDNVPTVAGATLVSGAAGPPPPTQPQPPPYVPPTPPALSPLPATPAAAAPPITLAPLPADKPAAAKPAPPALRPGTPAPYDPAQDPALAAQGGPILRLYPVSKLSAGPAPASGGKAGGPLLRLYPVSKLPGVTR